MTVMVADNELSLTNGLLDGWTLLMREFIDEFLTNLALWGFAGAILAYQMIYV
jgi:hypothetical protein